MSADNGFTLRAATPADAVTIQAQRDAMFRDMGQPAHQVQSASAESRIWLRRALNSGEYSGLLVEYGSEVVAGAGVIWQGLPPSPVSLASTRAYLLNVYVQPYRRGQGLARLLIHRLLNECQARGVTFISLHASEAGRPLYEHLGFKATNELRLMLEPPP